MGMSKEGADANGITEDVLLIIRATVGHLGARNLVELEEVLRQPPAAAALGRAVMEPLQLLIDSEKLTIYMHRLLEACVSPESRNSELLAKADPLRGWPTELPFSLE